MGRVTDMLKGAYEPRKRYLDLQFGANKILATYFTDNKLPPCLLIIRKVHPLSDEKQPLISKSSSKSLKKFGWILSDVDRIESQTDFLFKANDFQCSFVLYQHQNNYVAIVEATDISNTELKRLLKKECQTGGFVGRFQNKYAFATIEENEAHIKQQKIVGYLYINRGI
ncbi:hypothetical protein BK737_05570 [Bacillus thuringiensis serovar palmanyolensis]|uniref:hypothetical protein n=1 Tax=Bacillus thuringiensis TaxID=1428 RepID=UPI000B6E1351|nr:hypothetical protein [Bacillus thuringiensis]OUB35435.1 hypothetical protein BK737_05570 [Bacillus thuringiensis serovar palmanyolensis]